MPTLAEIRLRACKLWPYGSHAILSLVPVEKPGLGTMAVDQHWRLYYDPAEIAKQPLDKSAGVLLHEISHLALKHHRRAERMVAAGALQEQWHKWNMAADYAVNSMLLEQDIPLWDGMLDPKRDGLVAGLSAEEYFRQLTAPKPQAEQPKEESGDGSEGEDENGGEEVSADGEGGDAPTDSDEKSAGGGDESESSGDEHGGEDGKVHAERGDGDGGSGGHDRQDSDVHKPKGDQGGRSRDTGRDGDDQESGSDGAGGQAASAGSDAGGSGQAGGWKSGNADAGDESAADFESVCPGGSCADGRQRSWELPAPQDCETPGLEPHEADVIIAETAKRILERDRGEGGGCWKRWADSVLKPRIDPRQALLRHVRAAVEQTSGLGDYSYRRPNRRNPRADVALPSNVQPIPRITVLVDTSGSMDQRDLGLALGLIGKVLNGFRIRDGIQVITGDVSAVTSARVFDPRQVNLVGGGGTDMGSLIKQAAEAKPKPQLIVVATDGVTPWGERVNVPVVACLTRAPLSLYPVPEWVKAVRIDEGVAS